MATSAREINLGESGKARVAIELRGWGSEARIANSERERGT
jgi:hypothetical protein